MGRKPREIKIKTLKISMGYHKIKDYSNIASSIF